MKKFLQISGKSIRRGLVLTLLTAMTFVTYGQSREFIRENIRKYGECRNVAITKTNGDVMIYGRNGYATDGCPSGLNNALKELNNEEAYIKDVQLTENGNWLVLYGSNGYRWSNIPYGLQETLSEYNRDREEITSVAFNDGGDWIVITTEHISASSDWIQNWLADGLKDHGQLWTVCITSDAMVAVYEKGYKFYGNVPDDLRSALKETSLNVYCLKIAGSAWFFADKNGSYRYNM